MLLARTKDRHPFGSYFTGIYRLASKCGLRKSKSVEQSQPDSSNPIEEPRPYGAWKESSRIGPWLASISRSSLIKLPSPIHDGLLPKTTSHLDHSLGRHYFSYPVLSVLLRDKRRKPAHVSSLLIKFKVHSRPHRFSHSRKDSRSSEPRRAPQDAGRDQIANARTCNHE